MSSIILHTESDPSYRAAIDSSRSEPLVDADADAADAIGSAVREVVGLLDAAASVAYTCSGCSALRMARERPCASVIGMTSRIATARRLALVWGVHAALEEGFGSAGATIVISAGMPFGSYATTNLLRIAQI